MFGLHALSKNPPYIKGFSEKLERACRPLKIRTTFSSKRTLRTELVHVKGQIMADKQKGVVYRVNCNTCNQTYIGETGRTLKVRLKEHHRAVNVSDANNGIAVHANEHDHPVDWSSAKILHKETNFIKRKVVEALHISETKHTMNLAQSHLANSYHCLDTAFFCIISFFCILTDEGLRSETSESNSVRNNILLRQCSKNSLSITNAVMSLYNIT